MRGSISTAGVPYTEQLGLVDVGPRRFETADTSRLDEIGYSFLLHQDRRPTPGNPANMAWSTAAGR